MVPLPRHDLAGQAIFGYGLAMNMIKSPAKLSRFTPKSILRLAALAAMAIAAACASVPKQTAINDIYRLAAALEARDERTINSLIDRRALSQQITATVRAHLLATIANAAGRHNGLDRVLAAAGYSAVEAANPQVEQAVEALLRPRILADLAALGGLKADHGLPSPVLARLVVRNAPPLGNQPRVCLPNPEHLTQCALYFTQYGDVWRWSGLNQEMLDQFLADSH